LGLVLVETVRVETIAAAETLLALEFTDAERAMLAESVAEQIAALRQRRAVTLPVDLGPASVFDPRLPGFTMPADHGFAWGDDDLPLPDSDEDIAFASLTALAGWVRRGKLSSLRLTQIYLDRIARLNSHLLCFATITMASALERATALDVELAAGRYRGPLHGIPYGLKDIIDTAGIVTDWGAEPYQGRVPAEDAFITTLLHEAGAVLLGKTTVGALAYGDIWHGGRTRNPWDLSEGSSGSSAGSASATAAGLVGFSIGTETLGSIVSPSTRCGTVGLRPTHGRVSRSGAMPLCWSLDKIGPICRGVADTALVLHALNQPDAADAFQIAAPFSFSATAPVAGLRLGYFPEDFAHEDAHALDHAALEAARRLGLTMVELTRPALPYESLTGILFAEAAASFEELTLKDRDDLLTWQDQEAWPNRFRQAHFLSAVNHVQLDRLRRLVMLHMAEMFAQADVIIGPSLAGPMLVITNFTGHPCLCLPSGFDQGRPRSISLWGRLFEEGPLLNLAQALEPQLHPKTARPVIPT
jgi:Asp-tRNA(Asn)/Glu-tRNA(Gln) amidotransferase A subunit family amidase